MLKRGIWRVDADDEVNEGIRITSMVLNQRLARFCRQTAPKTIQEMQTYSWDAKAALRGEEKPLKVHDHGPDAFRYFAKSEVSLPGGSPAVRVVRRHGVATPAVRIDPGRSQLSPPQPATDSRQSSLRSWPLISASASP